MPVSVVSVNGQLPIEEEAGFFDRVSIVLVIELLPLLDQQTKTFTDRER